MRRDRRRRRKRRRRRRRRRWRRDRRSVKRYQMCWEIEVHKKILQSRQSCLKSLRFVRMFSHKGMVNTRRKRKRIKIKKSTRLGLVYLKQTSLATWSKLVLDNTEILAPPSPLPSNSFLKEDGARASVSHPPHLAPSTRISILFCIPEPC